jgi:S1-C subfamily serine protease
VDLIPFTGLYNILSLAHKDGASGGPLLNAKNEVVGVISTSGFANRIDDESTVLKQWISGNDYLISSPSTPRQLLATLSQV